MTTKHTPATPLDIIEAFMRGPGDDAVPPSLRAVSDADAAEALRTARLDRDRLVEALRVVTEQAHQMTAMLFSQDYHEQGPPDYLSQVDALLRSLGEDT